MTPQDAVSAAAVTMMNLKTMLAGEEPGITSMTISKTESLLTSASPYSTGVLRSHKRSDTATSDHGSTSRPKPYERHPLRQEVESRPISVLVPGGSGPPSTDHLVITTGIPCHASASGVPISPNSLDSPGSIVGEMSKATDVPEPTVDGVSANHPVPPYAPVPPQYQTTASVPYGYSPYGYSTQQMAPPAYYYPSYSVPRNVAPPLPPPTAYPAFPPFPSHGSYYPPPPTPHMIYAPQAYGHGS
ncbi:hypothetical protein BC830DRAFT_1176049, partial [Chytriomyces sp. MP71]